MAIINQLYNKNVPVGSSLDMFAGKFLSGVLYKDDTWLESSDHACVVLFVDPNHPDPQRLKFEDIAREVVSAGHYFYLAYSYGQSGSMESPYALSSRAGQPAYHRMAYYGGLLTMSHLSHLESVLHDNLIADKPFTVVSQGEMGLGLASALNPDVQYNSVYPRTMVNNAIFLDPYIGQPVSAENGLKYQFLSAWQAALPKSLKSLMLFNSPSASLHADYYRQYARALRYGLDCEKLIVARTGVTEEVTVNADWTETQSNLWITHALNHRNSDGLFLNIDEENSLLTGI